MRTSRQIIRTPQNSSLHTVYLHQGCRRIRTLPAPGLVPPSQAPRTSVWVQPLPAQGGPAARQLRATHLAVYVVCQSQRRETHQSSPGRKSKHIVTGRLPPPSERCVTDRDSEGSERGGGLWAGEDDKMLFGKQKSWILVEWGKKNSRKWKNIWV